MYIVNMKIRFDELKAAVVLAKHEVDMCAVKQEILDERYDVDEVANQQGHPGQKMFIVAVNGYAHCVPYVIEPDGTYFLKAAFPSRIYQRRYKNGELKIRPD